MPSLAKRLLFRVHWVLGLTAGFVLAVVGVTGALIGFQDELTSLINPGLRVEVPAGAEAKPLDALIGAARSAHPDLKARGIRWEGDDEPLIVRMGRGRERGGAEIAVDPYSGVVLGEPRGARFFETVEQLHRNLAGGAVGKEIVGASTAILLVLAITGIVLRWPRRPLSPAAWLRINLHARGRGFLWQLHTVTATWLLVFYLLAALTGLWWSYDFYRNAINGLAGVTSPMRRPQPPRDADGEPASVSGVWASFRAAVPEADRAMLNLPADGSGAIDIRYQTDRSPHERAWDTIKLDADGHEVSRERYADLPRGRRFVASLFPLHSGDFFGWPGRVLMAFAALMMPFFLVTGIWMWIARRRNAKARADRAAAAPVLEKAYSR